MRREIQRKLRPAGEAHRSFRGLSYTGNLLGIESPWALGWVQKCMGDLGKHGRLHSGDRLGWPFVLFVIVITTWKWTLARKEGRRCWLEKDWVPGSDVNCHRLACAGNVSVSKKNQEAWVRAKIFGRNSTFGQAVKESSHLQLLCSSVVVGITWDWVGIWPQWPNPLEQSICLLQGCKGMINPFVPIRECVFQGSNLRPGGSKWPDSFWWGQVTGESLGFTSTLAHQPPHSPHAQKW